MLFSVALLAQPVKKGANATVVQNDDQERQDGIKRTHKYEMNCVIDPLKCKWKHGNRVLPILGLAPFLAGRWADTGMKGK